MKNTTLHAIFLLAVLSFNCGDTPTTTTPSTAVTATTVNLTTNPAAEAIEKTCMNYLEAFYEGDTTKVHQTLHPTLYKFGYWKNDKTHQYEASNHMTFQGAVDYAKRVLKQGEFRHKNSIKKVQILDISHHTAAAKVIAWWGTDYMLLAKHKDEWLIEQVLWEGPLQE